MPGGGLMGRQGATPGAPRWAIRRWGRQGRLAAASATSRLQSVWRLAVPPADAAEAPDALPGWRSPTAQSAQGGPPDVTSAGRSWLSAPKPLAPPQPGPTPVAAGPATYPHMRLPGSPPAPSPQTYPHMPWPDTGAAKGPLASPDAPAAKPMKRRAGAANLGYYQPNSRSSASTRPTPARRTACAPGRRALRSIWRACSAAAARGGQSECPCGKCAAGVGFGARWTE